ncbi:uncharacterized protein LOC118802227 [Colossoma macropomum]|uniref:uncharacterized protein LOC118802227 n=1 Tax=Colossoma macropomum TaxID=42526 RepID=UPI001863A82C|nr:uncharacterized protein LOC118802227 [Colossoma macropomum]
MVLTMKNKSRTPLKRKGKATKLMDSKPELKSSQTEEPTRKVPHRTRTSHAESNITTAALRANSKKTKKALEMADSEPKSLQKDEPTTKSLIDAESEESFLQPPKKRAIISDEVVSALKELPDVVKTLKELVAAMTVPPASPALSCSTSSSDLQPIASAPVEMITLAGGLMIPKRTFDHLSKTKMSIFHKNWQLCFLVVRPWPPQASLGKKRAKTPWTLQKSTLSLCTVTLFSDSG